MNLKKIVDNIKKEDLFKKLKNDYPSDKEIEITKEIIKKYNFKIGAKLTRLYLKSDVFLLACVFEKFIKVSITEFSINPLYCNSLLGYTWQSGLKYTRINLQTLKYKDLIFTLEIIVCGGLTSVMIDRYVKSNENKNLLYVDATKLHGHYMIQPLPYNRIEMWHGHPHLFMNKLKEILNTLDDSDIGYFVEVRLRYPDNIKEKTRSFPFCPEYQNIQKYEYNDFMKKISSKK